VNVPEDFILTDVQLKVLPIYIYIYDSWRNSSILSLEFVNLWMRRNIFIHKWRSLLRVHVVMRISARTYYHRHTYGGTFTWKLADPSLPKRYLLKASLPQAPVAVVTRLGHTREYTCTCVCTYTHWTRIPVGETTHSLRQIANVRSCTRSRTSRKRNRV